MQIKFSTLLKSRVLGTDEIHIRNSLSENIRGFSLTIKSKTFNISFLGLSDLCSRKFSLRQLVAGTRLSRDEPPEQGFAQGGNKPPSPRGLRSEEITRFVNRRPKDGNYFN